LALLFSFIRFISCLLIGKKSLSGYQVNRF
jgi:hypothetical protein